VRRDDRGHEYQGSRHQDVTGVRLCERWPIGPDLYCQAMQEGWATSGNGLARESACPLIPAFRVQLACEQEVAHLRYPSTTNPIPYDRP
jgi:hypothetical protein